MNQLPLELNLLKPISIVTYRQANKSNAIGIRVTETYYI